MAKYFNVRGFLDCSFEDLSAIRGIVAGYSAKGAEFSLDDEVVELYQAGWLYQAREINWVAHAFFGASVREAGVHLVLDQLANIARTLSEVDGVFFVDDDEGGFSQRWNVADGRVVVVDGGAVPLA